MPSATTYTSKAKEELKEPELSAIRTSKKWSIHDAIELYNIEGWGAGYFSVNAEGNLTMGPEGLNGPQIAILDVVKELEKQQIELPCLIRFHDILRHRVTMINESFLNAIQEFGYQGTYRGVYPVKVNQMREVIEEIVDVGEKYHFGLEAGSKAELQVALAYNRDPQALTICNGYKDPDYVRLALLGKKLGRKIILVVEKFSELKLCLDIAKEMGISASLGIRGKLTSKGSGKWQESGGELAKFGLTTVEMTEAVEYLKSRDQLSCLELFHFHIGSQIPNIRSLKSAVIEAARFYAHLRKLGAPIEYFDVGGGLGIDYDGSQSNSDFSTNYSLQEYCGDIVYQVQQVCDDMNIPHPTLVSESGRAIAAAHSCLIMNVIDQISPSPRDSWKASPTIQQSAKVQEMLEIFKSLNLKNYRENYHDAIAIHDQALSLFKLGHLSLEERACIEQIFSDLCLWIYNNAKRLKRVPDELEDLMQRIRHQYVVNFSVFQSAPDHWAFDQLFPIVPIHRMNERPKNNAILVDITCDSDGKIDRFIDREEDCSTSLPLHQLKPRRPYYLGMFLTGAYQDIMGDMHNLFGRVNEVHVFSDDDDPTDFYIEEVIRGDTLSTTLKTNQYSITELCKLVKTQADAKVKEGALKPREAVQLVDFYTSLLQSYTYLRR